MLESGELIVYLFLLYGEGGVGCIDFALNGSLSPACEHQAEDGQAESEVLAVSVDLASCPLNVGGLPPHLQVPHPLPPQTARLAERGVIFQKPGDDFGAFTDGIVKGVAEVKRSRIAGKGAVDEDMFEAFLVEREKDEFEGADLGLKAGDSLVNLLDPFQVSVQLSGSLCQADGGAGSVHERWIKSGGPPGGVRDLRDSVMVSGTA